MSQRYAFLTDNYGQTYELSAPLIKIGMGSDSQVILDNSGGLDLHAEIRADGSNWVLWDLSTNSSMLVNNKPIQDPQPLYNGDVISIGDSILRFNAAQAMGEMNTENVATADLSSFRSSGEIQSIDQSLPVSANQVIPAATQKQCKTCGKLIYEAAEICPHCGVRQIESSTLVTKQPKNRVTAALLAIFLGGIGVHKFYLGKIGLGILYLLFSWTWIPLIVGIIEGIYYLTLSDEAFAKQFDQA